MSLTNLMLLYHRFKAIKEISYIPSGNVSESPRSKQRTLLQYVRTDAPDNLSRTKPFLYEFNVAENN